MRGRGVLYGWLLAWALCGWAACPPLPLPPNGVVEAEAQGDVTGDGAPDQVYLVGIHTQPAKFADAHQLLIVSDAGGTVTTFPLGPDSGGYPGTLFLGRINGERTPDILAGIPTGGSGGIIRYYLLTDTGGTPAFLLNPATFNAGIPLTVTLQPNYAAVVAVPSTGQRYTLDLRDAHTPAELRKIYGEIYAPSGRLLVPTTGTIDPYGYVEPVDVDRDGFYELLGYRNIWVRYHANSVATARDVWRWTPAGLRGTSVTITPTGRDYVAYLRTLTRLAPDVAVPSAITRFRQWFVLAPPAWRDEAFREFLAWHGRLIATTNTAFRGDETHLEARARRFNAVPANRTAGLEAVYEGEGSWVVRAREGFYLAQFGKYVTPQVRDYLALRDVELHRPFGLDALVISVTALGQRWRAWERYLEQYPDSPFRADAWRYFTWEQDAFLYGLNNTSHFAYDTHRMRPGVRAVLQRYVAVHPGTLSARRMQTVLALYIAADDTMTPALQAALDRFRATLDPTHAENYFPATDGTWTYTGGPAPTTTYTADRAALVGSITRGHTWISGGERHMINTTRSTLTVLGHTYLDVIEVVRTPQPPGDTSYEIHDYYAIGIGLIRSDHFNTGSASQWLLCEFTKGS